MRLSSRFIHIVGVAIILLCALTTIAFNVVTRIDDGALAQTAQRIGVTPTHNNVFRYAYSSVHNGMSRQEVEAQLKQIGPFEVQHRGKLITDGGIEPYACDTLILHASPFFGNFHFRACYYGEGESLFQWTYQD